MTSVLRKADSDSVQQFTVQSTIEEMKTHAPSVLTVLRGCLHGRKRSRAKKLKSCIIDVDSRAMLETQEGEKCPNTGATQTRDS